MARMGLGGAGKCLVGVKEIVADAKTELAAARKQLAEAGMSALVRMEHVETRT